MDILEFVFFILGIIIFLLFVCGISLLFEKINQLEFNVKIFDKYLDKETKRRIKKTLSWRIISTIATFIIAYFVMGSMIMAMNLALINLVLKSIMFYYHEKYWDSKNV